MDASTSLVFSVTIFRLAIVAAGLVCIVLGYRLFVKGVWPGTDSHATASKLTPKHAAPGTLFSLFGAALICIVLFNGGTPAFIDALNAADAEPPSTANRDLVDDEYTTA